jgi:hypothetical protein
MINFKQFYALVTTPGVVRVNINTKMDAPL